MVSAREGRPSDGSAIANFLRQGVAARFTANPRDRHDATGVVRLVWTDNQGIVNGEEN